MLSISCSRAFASSLLSSRDDVWEGTDGAMPDLAHLFGAGSLVAKVSDHVTAEKKKKERERERRRETPGRETTKEVGRGKIRMRGWRENKREFF